MENGYAASHYPARPAGALLVVDYAATPRDGSIVPAIVNGEFAARYLRQNGQRAWLASANPRISEIKLIDSIDIVLVGVVIGILIQHEKQPAHFCLVDCNNFYASCECVFNPPLEGPPIIVLSNCNGYAFAPLAEAKALGIEMGTPASMIEDLILSNNVRVFSSNYALYSDASDRVMDILALYAPVVELYSIDEALLDFTGIQQDPFFDSFGGYRHIQFHQLSFCLEYLLPEGVKTAVEFIRLPVFLRL